ncbi:MerR family DNA-binding transcriptional regulator, partial [Streptococcus suis]
MTSRYIIYIQNEGRMNMNIKEVSDVTGLSAYTIRYYERVGLIPKIARKSSGV